MTNDYGNLELHTVLLSAMKDIDKICRENGLRYYLYAGTLLGAVQYGGFIPWDDDVDIVMFPEDYCKFCQILNEEYSAHYRMETFNNMPSHYSMMSKMRILGTEVRNEKGEAWPFFVDVSELHVFPSGKVKRFVQRKEIELLNLALCTISGEVTPVSVASKLTFALLAKYRKETLGKRLQKVLCRYDNSNNEEVGIMCNTLTSNPYTGVCGYENDKTLRIQHDNVLYISFEGTEFMTISNPERDLICRYGSNWDKPFPEEKRVTKHDVKSYYISDEVRKRVGL